MRRWIVTMLVVLGLAVGAKAQWYQLGGGLGPELSGAGSHPLAGNFASAINPDCNSGLCMPQWDQEITFSSNTANSGWCGRVVDPNYAINFCIEATKQANGLWNTNAIVYYQGSQILNVLVLQNQSTPVGQRVWFSENFYNSQYVRYDFKWATVNTTNWSPIHSFYELRNTVNPYGQPTTVGHLVYSPGNCSAAGTPILVHIDGWTTYETPGRTSPNLLDTDFFYQVCTGTKGQICDQDECKTSGQILYQNQ